MTKHINIITSQICQNTWPPQIILHPATPSVKEATYSMLIRPKLEYGAVAWNPYRL